MVYNIHVSVLMLWLWRKVEFLIPFRHGHIRIKSDRTNIMKQEEEIWNKIDGYPNCLVSNFGNIWSIHKGELKHQSLDKDGYPCVSLMNGKKDKSRKFVHRLVALSFIPRDPFGVKDQVNHKDGNKENNHFSNLEWVTGSENVRHAVKVGLFQAAFGINNGKAKLTNEDVKEIMALRSAGVSRAEIAERFNITPGYVTDLFTGTRRSKVT
jgi:hypothetical protein